MHACRKALTAALVALATLTFAAEGTASAVPPECDAGNPDCPGKPEPAPDDDPDGGDGTAGVKAPPPVPWGTPKEMTTADFAFLATTSMRQKLSGPPVGDPWPHHIVPFRAEVEPEPVLVRQVEDNLWAFASFDKGGRPTDCMVTCAYNPYMRFDRDADEHQATLTLRPRLDVEFWYVGIAGMPARKAEVTATLYVRAYAECGNWSRGSGTLNLRSGIDLVTVDRDTSWLEDAADATFWQGITSDIDGMISQQLGNSVGEGRFSPIPSAAVVGHGTPCYSLGVRGTPADGAIRWNPDCGTAWRCKALEIDVNNLPVLT